MFRKLSLVLIAVLVVFSLGVNSLGLGEIKLDSGLNQPLKAEIMLFSPEGMSEFEVSASLASMAEFEKAGIDYFNYLRDIRFKTIRREGDVLVIEVSTRQPIKEPYLNFLVELNWPKGRMLREYTVLLDPPVFSKARSATVNTTQTTQDKSPRTTTTSTPRTTTRSTTPATPRITGTTYGPVGEAETLWRIASGVRPADASIHQTLVALYRANPDAFLNNDINLLKEGSTLVIPDAESIMSTPRRAALQDMVARLRGGSKDTVLDTTGRSSTQKNTTRGQDRLRLATPKSSSTGSVSGSGEGNQQEVSRLKDQLSQSKEATATLEAENEELRRKLQDALEKIEKDKGAGVNIDSTEGAAIANQKEVFADTKKDEEQKTPEQTPTTEQGGQETTTGTTEQGGTKDTTEQGPEQQVEETKKDTTKTVTPPASKPTGLSAPPQSTSFFDDPLYLYGAIGLVVILLGAFAVIWKMRQRMSDDEFQDDLVVSAQGGGFDSDDSFDVPDSADDLLGDFDTDDVFEDESETEADPLGEADIYIAYGKYDQAEKLLIDAIGAQNERNDLKLKLLECYAETKDKDKFEAAYQQFADDFSSDGDAQQQYHDIKSSAWPEDADLEDDFELPSTEEIFGDDSSSQDLDDDFSLDDLDTESDVSLDDDFSTDELGGEEPEFETDDLDFDLDEEPASDAKGNDDFSLDDELLDTSDDDLDLDSDMSLDLDSDDNDLDLDLDSDSTSADSDDFDLDSSPSDSASGSDDFSLDDDDLNMDLDDDFDLGDDDDLDADLMDGTDEASTKLDLARAYIDMGDVDGAKEILNEVVEEGSEAHKSEALSLLEKI